MTPFIRAAVRLYRLWQCAATLADRRRLHARLHVYWAQMFDDDVALWRAATGVQHLRPWYAPREERIEWPV